MHALIREYRPDDEAAIVDLSLRAWAPVFASLENVLRREMSGRLHGDWRQYQQRAVRDVMADPVCDCRRSSVVQDVSTPATPR
jgi:hypothetical protein